MRNPILQILGELGLGIVVEFDEAMNARFSEVYRLMWDTATSIAAPSPPIGVKG
jgi:hypothetical protein